MVQRIPLIGIFRFVTPLILLVKLMMSSINGLLPAESRTVQCSTGNRPYTCHSEEFGITWTTKKLIFIGPAEVLRGVYPACPELVAGSLPKGSE
jgi:hypothetical protein